MIEKEWLFQYKEDILNEKAVLLNKKILDLTIELDKTKIERNKLMFDLKESGKTLKTLSEIFKLSQTAVFDIVLNEERGYKTALKRRYEKNVAKISTP